MEWMITEGEIVQRSLNPGFPSHYTFDDRPTKLLDSPSSFPPSCQPSFRLPPLLLLSVSVTINLILGSVQNDEAIDIFPILCYVGDYK